MNQKSKLLNQRQDQELNLDINNILKRIGEKDSFQRHLELSNIIKDRIEVL